MELPKKIFILALERLESRYTGQWYVSIPRALRRYIKRRKLNIKVYVVAGKHSSGQTTPGSFLNFTDTNIWKNHQTNTIAKYFAEGVIQPGDKFLIPDAWHTGIQQIKYMSELLDIPVEIHSIFHAGSYDPQDFLGRKIKDKNWTYNLERSFYYASDYNYFATNFHAKLFSDTILDVNDDHSKIVISGQPHDELVRQILPFRGKIKKRQIIFPHRLAPEKQVEIFEDLSKHMPDVEFIVCQKKSLTKLEYHQLLAESAIVFSANLQETLGISSCIEGPLVDCVPIVPNRLSYAEIFEGYDDFLYPSEWTINWDSYIQNREQLVNLLYSTLDNYTNLLPTIKKYQTFTLPKYADADEMINRLIA